MSIRVGVAAPMPFADSIAVQASLTLATLIRWPARILALQIRRNMLIDIMSACSGTLIILSSRTASFDVAYVAPVANVGYWAHPRFTEGD